MISFIVSSVASTAGAAISETAARSGKPVVESVERTKPQRDWLFVALLVFECGLVALPIGILCYVAAKLAFAMQGMRFP